MSIILYGYGITGTPLALRIAVIRLDRGRVYSGKGKMDGRYKGDRVGMYLCISCNLLRKTNKGHTIFIPWYGPVYTSMKSDDTIGP